MLIIIFRFIFFLLFFIKIGYKQGSLRIRFFVRIPCPHMKSPETSGAVVPHQQIPPCGQPCCERAGQEHPKSVRESMTVSGPYRKQNRKEELLPEILRSVRILFEENAKKHADSAECVFLIFYFSSAFTARASTNLLSDPPPEKREEQTECTGKNARCRGSFSGHSDW